MSRIFRLYLLVSIVVCLSAQITIVVNEAGGEVITKRFVYGLG